MNSLRHLRCVCFFTIASAMAEDAVPVKYATAKEILAMPATTAKVAKRLSVFSASLTTSDGKTFVLGDAAGAQEVWHFVGTLKEGQSYIFPDAFRNYLDTPSFSDSKEIKAMTPRTGTLAARSPCSAFFNGVEGKGFHLGGPSSGAEVTQFLWSLEAGKSYKFPDAFVAFLATPTFATAKEVAAMTERTGTLTGMFEGACYFATADGKGFVIGDRGHNDDRRPVEDREVQRFLHTLQEEASYKFPGAFLEFQQGKK